MSVDAKDRLGGYDKLDLTYKVINETSLQATILTPKVLQSQPSGSYPTLVRWHGGGFIVGHRLYEGWFALWLLEFALSKNAIIITADYRLIPGASGTEILSDITTFWTWLHGTLPSISETWHAEPDLNRIACCGESAGGYLAVFSALLVPGSKIKAIISDSAALNFDVSDLKVPRPRVMMGTRPPPPRQAEALIRAYLKKFKEDGAKTRTGCEPGELWELTLCIFQQAYLPRLWWVKGESTPLSLMQGIEREEESKRMKPIWVIHGMNDTMVGSAASTTFVRRLEEVLPSTPVLMNLEVGDHMFDLQYRMDVDWIKKGCEFIEKYWI
ncbi:hypothetical protein VTL71DRAFT_3025 [Oculimacula yallundae]|uniref:Alpha/beta hydrolase fold-3 domain-containing protein n=1 Tax=Oculimacula yallundae TaxID=86028 RepID=A0ABR4C5Y2_9HELO